MAVIIAPSILAADFGSLADDIKKVDAAGADWIHVDIMDGHYVPNISFGADVMAAVRHATAKPFDVHLMVAPCDPYLESFAEAGADLITIHPEAGPHVHRSLQTIRALGKRAGLALNPGTPADVIEPLLDEIDLVLVMTVNPGFGGQAFLPAMVEKIRRVKALTASRAIAIEVDGGIGPSTAAAVAAAGAGVLVAGSAIFKGGTEDSYRANIDAIRMAAETAIGTAA